MQHIDEHTIELYVLGASTVQERKDEIEAHFRECYGCRALAEEIDHFYEETFEKLEQAGPVDVSSEALVPIRRDISLYDEPYAPPIPYRPATVIGKIGYFTRRHPLMAGAGSFVAAAALALALFFSLKDVTKDPNPVYIHLNSENATIDAYNRENQLLWKVPAKSVYHLNTSDYYQASNRIIVTNLMHGDRNVVITALPVLDDNSSSHVPLTILSSHGDVFHKTWFTTPILYRGVQYNTNLNPDNLLIDDFSGDGTKEIIVTANNGRSPNVIYRLAADGRILGEYLHFGLLRMTTVNMRNDGRRQIVLFGENDTGEPDSLPYPVAIILDMKKLTGRTQAGDSPGFGLPPSDADLVIIRFPLSDMNLALSAKGSVVSFHPIRYGDTQAFSATIMGTSADPATDQVPTFEYIIGADLRVREVKFDSHTLLYRNRMLSERKITGKLDTRYLETLKERVRYWDGKEWKPDFASVNQPESLSLH